LIKNINCVIDKDSHKEYNTNVNDNQYQKCRSDNMNQEERLQEITSQRKMLLEVILSNEHSSCKEIYFAAKQIDNRLGIATVYRTVQLLEDLDLIRKEMAVQI